MTLGHVFVCRMHSAPTAGLLLTIKIQPNVCPSGKLNVKDNELEDMLKEASGPINFTMFLNLFGEKLHGKTADWYDRVTPGVYLQCVNSELYGDVGTDPEDTITNAFKMFDPDAKGFVHKDEYVLIKFISTQV